MIKIAGLCGVEPVDILLLPKGRIVLLAFPSHLPAVQSCFSLPPHTSAGVGHTSCCIALTFNKGQKISAVGEQIAFCHLGNLLCLSRE